MRFVLLSTTALIVCAQAAPQFNRFDSQSGDLEIHIIEEDRQPNIGHQYNRNNGPNQHGLPVQTTFTQYRRPDHHGSQMNWHGQFGQNRNPTGVNTGGLTNMALQYIPQFQGNNQQSMLSNIPFMGQYLQPSSNRDSNWGIIQIFDEPLPQNHGGSQPQFNRNNRPGRPQFNQNNRPGPTQIDQNNRPGRPQTVNGYNPEICQANLSPNVVDTSTTTNRDVGNIPSSTEVPLTSVKPQVGNDQETVTQTTVDNSVQTTTEFDWNNFIVGASADNTGGSGAIDIRGNFN